jgi:hypothetical protein
MTSAPELHERGGDPPQILIHLDDELAKQIIHGKTAAPAPRQRHAAATLCLQKV